MIQTLYIVLLAFVLFGGFLNYLVCRNISRIAKKEKWKKYFVYVLIVHLVFISIAMGNEIYAWVNLALVIMALSEIIRLMILRGKWITGLTGLVVLGAFAIPFVRFGFMDSETHFIVFFIVIVFDAFSQLIGQLFGRNTLWKWVSPNKTVEGVIGGFVFAFLVYETLSAFVIRSAPVEHVPAVFICIAALCGDLLASALKRFFGVKDYNNLLPGQGGFLDRFDSYIMAGAVIYILSV
ncbi:MAG: hypothetical protein GC181_15925 [Bacteroidetes bacterium]|nr:hypothetical protein [Bacteroidota bacterium]